MKINEKNLAEKDKKQILKAIIGNLKDISDKEYQERVWIRAEGPEIDDFDETVNLFAPDARIIIEEYKDFRLTVKQRAILKKFYDEFEVFYRNNYSELEFIDTPEWARIMAIAKEPIEVLKPALKLYKPENGYKFISHFMNLFIEIRVDINEKNQEELEEADKEEVIKTLIHILEHTTKNDDIDGMIHDFSCLSHAVIAKHREFRLTKKQYALLKTFRDNLNSELSGTSSFSKKIAEELKSLLKFYHPKKIYKYGFHVMNLFIEMRIYCLR